MRSSFIEWDMVILKTVNWLFLCNTTDVFMGILNKEIIGLSKKKQEVYNIHIKSWYVYTNK